MRWKGALEGAVIGSWLGGKKGAFIGAILGDIYEYSQTGGSSEAAFRQAYNMFFQCLGKLGNEQFAKRILVLWNCGEELCNEFIAEVNAGSRSSQSFEELISSLNRAAAAAPDEDFKSNATELLCMTIPLDNPLANEWKLLKKAGEILGTSQQVENFMERNYIYGYSGTYTEQQLKNSCRRLWLSPEASNAEIKQAYHREVWNLPANRISGTGISNEFVNSASECFQSAVKAYKILCKARKIK